MFISLNHITYIRMILIFWLFLFAFVATDFTWKCLATYAQNVNNEITELIAVDNQREEDETSLDFLAPNPIAPNSPSLKCLNRRGFVSDIEPIQYKETDLLLVATVDGALHGVEASTGDIKWSQRNLGTPLVNTNFEFTKKIMSDPEDLNLDDIETYEKHEEIRKLEVNDEIRFLPEPGGSGNLYYMEGDQQLQSLPIPLKGLVELSPFRDKGKLYSANKRTSFLSVNPKTGDIIHSPKSSPSINRDAAPYFSPNSKEEIISNTGTLVLGLVDYEITVHDEETNSLIWSVALREFVPDKRADASSSPSEFSQKTKPKLDVDLFPFPVIFAFDVLVEENERKLNQKQTSLVARRTSFSDLDIPSSVSMKKYNTSAFVGRHGDSYYALSSEAFPYMRTSKFSNQESNHGGDNQVIISGPASNHIINNERTFYDFLVKGSIEENTEDPTQEEEVTNLDWRRFLWLFVGSLLAICGYKEIQNNQLLKRVDDSRKKAKLKGKKSKEEKKESFKISGPVKAQYRDDGSTLINTITVTPTVLGYGSHGTIVYKGQFQGRDVAVKRMLKDLVKVAEHEVTTLEDSDNHPNVVRYYCMERCEQFMYLALELCPTSLQGLIENPAKLSFKCAITPQDMLYQIMLGLHHLHSLKIVHRDIKPHNILIACAKDRFGQDRPPRVLISDFGLCKKLEEDQSSFHNTVASGAAAGTMGWRAPEILMNSSIADELSNPSLLNEHSSSSGQETGSSSITLPALIDGNDKKSKGRITRAVDIFSTGCVFYYILTSGKHPFGERYARESRVVEGKSDLKTLLNDANIEFKAEAHDLISQMIHADPSQRPDSSSVLLHPYFWGANKKLAFLQDISDQLEAEAKVGYKGERLEGIEDNAISVIGEDWQKRMDNRVLNDLHRYRGYDGAKIKDLLRVIRNKKHHYQDLPHYVKKAYGALPEGFLNYFLTRYPALLLHAYYTLAKHPVLPKDPIFRTYFQMTNNPHI